MKWGNDVSAKVIYLVLGVLFILGLLIVLQKLG